MFYVVESFDHHYLTNRKATGSMYQSRSSWSKSFDDAKVFSTKAAATRSANDNGEKGYWVVEARLILGDAVKTVSFEEDNDD